MVLEDVVGVRTSELFSSDRFSSTKPSGRTARWSSRTPGRTLLETGVSEREQKREPTTRMSQSVGVACLILFKSQLI